MPIRRELRWFYPIDWPELSWSIRFDRARGRCETCRRPHRQTVRCLPDGRWLDEAADTRSGPPGSDMVDARRWRDGRGRRCPLPSPAELAELRATRVVLATAHLDHDPANNRSGNLRSLCQCCHLRHDQPHHLAQRWLNRRRRWAIGDLFLGTYVPLIQPGRRRHRTWRGTLEAVARLRARRPGPTAPNETVSNPMLTFPARSAAADAAQP